MGYSLPGDVGGSADRYAPGSRLAGYRLEEQIGRGGMAVAFRARDERLDRVVALKILAPSLAADEAFRQRFIRESQAAAAVDDPHIIPVYEAGEAGGVLYIAMRYVPGGDLRTVVRRDGPLIPARAAAITWQVASALDAAHEAGLVHRDVKPANMLVDVRSGQADHVYLADFGLSKRTQSTSGLTETGQFLGTVDYISPEQIQGNPTDGRTDQYALACSTYELICGQPPFRRDEAMAVMYAQLREPLPPLSARRRDLPPAVDQVFGRALAKAAAQRFPSCREFAYALLQTLGLAPSRPSPSGPARPPNWVVPSAPARGATPGPVPAGAPGPRVAGLGGVGPGGAPPGNAVPGGARPGGAGPGNAVPGSAVPGGARPGDPRLGNAVPRGPGSAGARPGGSGPRGPGLGSAGQRGAGPGGPAPASPGSAGSGGRGAGPNGALPGSAVPRGPVPQGPAPHGPVPQGRTPQTGVPQGGVPQGPVPQGPVPQGPVPQGGVQQGRTPQGGVPQGGAPQGRVPQGRIPQGGVPQGAMRQGAMPPGAMPRGAVPQGPVPQGAVPQGAVPQGAVPQGAVLRGAGPGAVGPAPGPWGPTIPAAPQYGPGGYFPPRPVPPKRPWTRDWTAWTLIISIPVMVVALSVVNLGQTGSGVGGALFLTVLVAVPTALIGKLVRRMRRSPQ